MGCNRNHAVCQKLCPGRNDAKTKARIDEGVISLPDFVRHALIFHRLGRNPRSDKGTAFGPGNEVTGPSFGKFRRVAKRKDDGPLRMGSHFLDNRFCKGP